MSNTKNNLNRLADEKSPYLLQHADNPVNWYPWSEEAFKLAKENNKPIFLSIGYSTCHWCHVMAHESFEDEEVANLINEVFVPIKLDREERPDIDNIYMTVCQMMTGSGGWPLTIIMTPDKKPFYAATYIPKESRYGRLGLKELIPRISELWLTKRKDIIDSSDSIYNALSKENEVTDKVKINTNIFNQAYSDLKYSFDPQYGGFGNEPKFPMPHQQFFLLNYYLNKKNDTALKMVQHTLNQMRAGGIYDHLGYGFHRYSTDDKWHLPHFEKMLYDQALLINLYTYAYQITKEPIYNETVDEIVLYLINNMKSEKGCFYSAEDADSEGEEGKYYVWEKNELKDSISKYFINKENEDINLEKLINRFLRLYNIEETGNFHDESTNKKNNKNILYINNDDNKENLKKEFLKENKMTDLRNHLLDIRSKRVHPYKDDKVLTDWNSLTIAALARAAFVLENDSYMKLAEGAFDFIENKLLNKDNSLFHRYRDGDSAIAGTLNDYAFLVWGLIELYQSTFKVKYLRIAIDINEYMMENFWDNKESAFYIASKENDDLIFHNKEVYDGAIPSGNSVALLNLVRLSHLSGNHDLEIKAQEMVEYFSQKIKNAPSAYCQFLIGLQSLLLPYFDIIIVGKKDDSTTIKILNMLRDEYNSNISITIIPVDKNSKDYIELSSIYKNLQDYKQINNKTTIYICKDHVCQLPVTNIGKVKKMIK
ncbi:MAG: thioredoxin domain-containing protein [bacterium]